MEQRDVDRVQEFRKCIECFLCQDVCHVLRDHHKHEQFIGPRFLVYAAALEMHPLDAKTACPELKERTTASAYCNITKCCTRSAPSTSPSPTTPSSRSRERVVDRFYDPISKLLQMFKELADQWILRRRKRADTASAIAADAAAALPTAAATREQFVSIVWLRAIASLMVVWTHLVSIFRYAHNVNWLTQDRRKRRFRPKPLGLVEGFSMFGVDIFFVISGFVITRRSKRGRVCGKRILRIYPALLLSLVIASVTLASCLSYFGSAFPSAVTPTWTTFWQSLSLLRVLPCRPF